MTTNPFMKPKQAEEETKKPEELGAKQEEIISDSKQEEELPAKEEDDEEVYFPPEQTLEHLVEYEKQKKDQEIQSAISNNLSSDSKLDDLMESGVTYSSHPIVNYRLGDYQFERSQLTLSPEKAAEFDEFLKGMPAITQNQITKIDADRAEQLIQAHKVSKLTSGFDTTANSFGNTTES